MTKPKAKKSGKTARPPRGPSGIRSASKRAFDDVIDALEKAIDVAVKYDESEDTPRELCALLLFALILGQRNFGRDDYIGTEVLDLPANRPKPRRMVLFER